MSMCGTQRTWVVAAAMVFAAVFGALLLACSSDANDVQDPGTADGGDGGGTPDPTVSVSGLGPQALPVKGAGFTCEVKKMLTFKCQTCHTDPPQGGALVPLMTVKQLLAWSPTQPSKTVAQVALERMQDTEFADAAGELQQRGDPRRDPGVRSLDSGELRRLLSGRRAAERHVHDVPRRQHARGRHRRGHRPADRGRASARQSTARR